MKFGIVFKEENKKAKDAAAQVKAYLDKNGQEVKNEKSLDGSDVIIALGGDGTLIHKACEYVSLNVPFIGINTGNLGFLTAAEADDWQDAVGKLIRGEYFVSERISIEARVNSKVFRAVNEVVVRGLYRVIDLEINDSGKKLLQVQGDGVIISSPTGSTAYSLSAGGPIVDPDLDSLLVTPINPIGLPIPSIVLSPQDEIEVTLNKGDDVSLVLDGQEHTKVLTGQSVKVSKGEYKIKFVYFDKHQFIKSLNAKFGLSTRSVG